MRSLLILIVTEQLHVDRLISRPTEVIPIPSDSQGIRRRNHFEPLVIIDEFNLRRTPDRISDRELGLPSVSPAGVDGNPQVYSSVVPNPWHDTSGAQDGDDFGHCFGRVWLVPPLTKGLLVRDEKVGLRIGMVAEAGARDVDFLATEHMSVSGPHK